MIKDRTWTHRRLYASYLKTRSRDNQLNNLITIKDRTWTQSRLCQLTQKLEVDKTNQSHNNTENELIIDCVHLTQKREDINIKRKTWKGKMIK